MGAAIDGIAYVLPDEVLDNARLEQELGDWDAAKIESKVGIRSRRIAAKHETAIDLGERAARKLLDEADPGRVDAVLVCTQSPDRFVPTSSCVLQSRLGLSSDVQIIEYNLGCSGFVYGLALAKGLIAGGSADTVLLLTAETYCKHIHARDRANRTIFGDAAAATLVRRSSADRIHGFAFGTDGSGFRELIIPNGGARSPYDPQAELIEETNGGARTANDLFMSGPDIFNFTIRMVPRLLEATLERCACSMAEIDLFVLHQANRFMLSYLRKVCKIPEDKLWLFLRDVGNTVSSTIPIALEEAYRKGAITSGDKVALLGFGVGYSWAGTVIEA